MDPRRSRPLVALRARLNAVTGAEDAEQFLGDDVGTDIDELTPFLVTSEGVDTEVLNLLGMVHFVRSAAAGSPDESEADWRVAVTLLWPAFLSDPGMLPEPIVAAFSQAGGQERPEGEELVHQHAEAVADVAFGLLTLHETGHEHAARVAIRILSESAATLPEDRPTRPHVLCNLGFALLTQPDIDSDPEKLDELVTVFQASFDAMTMLHPDYWRAATGLAVSLRGKAFLTDDEELLGEAVAMFRTAVNVVPPEQEDRLSLLAELGHTLVVWSGAVEPDVGRMLLLEAITAQNQVRQLLPELNPVLLSQFGYGQLEAHRAGVEGASVDEAVELLKQAVEGYPPGSEEQSSALDMLHLALEAQVTQQAVERRGPKEKAIDEMLRRSIPAEPGGTAADPDTMEAILARLLGVAPNDDDSRSGQLMDFLSTVLRYPVDASMQEVRLKGTELLSRQVSHLEPHEQLAELLKLAQPGEEPEQPRAVDTTGLDEVVELLDRVVRETPPDQHDPALILVNATRMQLRLVTVDRGDPKAMAELGYEAMRALPEMMANARLPLNIIEPMTLLGQTMVSPFEALRDIESEARKQRDRLAGAQDDIEVRKALAIALFTHFQLSNHDDVFQEAVVHARMVTSATSPPDARTAGMWGSTAASRAFNGSVGGGGPRGLAGMASDRAARSLGRNDAPGALEEIEEGRALMISTAFNTRRELDSLRRADPELAERFSTMRDRIRRTLSTGAMPDFEQFQAQADQWRELVEQVKALPDFDRFLMPLPLGLEELKPAAVEGPVVVVNANEHRSDALVLRLGGALTVPLPGLRPAELAHRAEQFHDALASSDVDEREAVLLDTLGWLWDVVAEPVLDRLGCAPEPEDWPRLWWSPTGVLNFLPLHAAGRHDQPGMSVLDRVVSSYTPTIRALMHSRAGAVHPHRTALAVAMPETPGHTSLPATRVDAESLAARMPGPLPMIGPEATRSGVLFALPHANIAHFACHAGSDPADPSASHLLLHDGPLDVTTISRLRLENAELAYLSACATARGGFRFADEALHIASAFQLAGFSQVVATMWAVADNAAAVTAAGFHHELADAIARPARLPGARALHKVTRELRDTWAAFPSSWAGYIHAGA
ncbi:MAG: CHAT domain-containing protein [Kibdelosporangium sp.]